jgi:hypothetical protein
VNIARHRCALDNPAGVEHHVPGFVRARCKPHLAFENAALRVSQNQPKRDRDRHRRMTPKSWQ